MSIPHGPQITATVENTRATVLIGTRTAELESADHDDLVRQVLLTATSAAANHGGPLHMTITDQDGITEMLVHPDGRRELATNRAQALASPQDDDLITTTPPARTALAERTPHRAPADHPEHTGPAGDPQAAPLIEQAPQDVSPAGEPRPTRRELREQSFLTTTREEAPASTGWRGALARIGIKTTPSAAELARRADERAVSQHWPGPRTVAIVNGKGGASKTPTTILLSAVLARYGGSGVLAWDNNPTRGTLGWRTEQGPHEHTVLDLLPHTEDLLAPGARTAELSHWVHHQREDRYDVLRSNPTVLAPDQRITADAFDDLHRVATKYFRLVIIDSGNDESDEAWLRMIEHADHLVVATTTREEHAESGRLLLAELGRRDQRSAHLADDALVVVSQASTNDPAPQRSTEAFQAITRAAVAIPYDPAMGGRPLTYNSLSTTTQRAWLRAAAALAQGLDQK